MAPSPRRSSRSGSGAPGPRYFQQRADYDLRGSLDTAKKTLILEEDALRKLCVPITKHDKLPDIVLYDETRNWLFLIEAPLDLTCFASMALNRIVE